MCERTFKDVPCLSRSELGAQEVEAAKASFVNESFLQTSFGEHNSHRMDLLIDKKYVRRSRVIPRVLAVRTGKHPRSASV